MELDDIVLLRQFAQSGSDAAFAELVSRHIGFVYSSALRQVGDPYQAEEIVQAVFVILAQKAGEITDKTILTGWLFKTTRFVALTHLRTEARRRNREQEAQMQIESQTDSDETWKQLAPLLDEALEQLGETDRQAVLLRFFEKKSLAEVASALGTGEDAAQKRVRRAVEKLQHYFHKHGIASTTAVLAGTISTNSVHAAPVALAKSVMVVAAAKGTAASGSTLALTKGALKIMAWTKAKTAMVVTVAAIITGAVITPILSHNFRQENSTRLPQSSGRAQSSDLPKSADEATRAIFEAWGRGDWKAFYSSFGEPGVSPEVYEKVFNDRIKSALAGVEIVSLGKPTISFGPNMWFVPYEIRFKDGGKKKFRLHVAQDPVTKHWYFKGGF